MIERDFVSHLKQRLTEKAPLIQVLLGPRQVGKTTGVKQVLAKFKVPYHYFSADDILAPSRNELLEQWQKTQQLGTGALLVIDEVQKIPNWSEIIKNLWDKQKSGKRIKCVLLGSSSLSLQKGLTESLTGRFELIPVFHWNYEESRRAFGLTLDQYLTYGGYPGSYVYLKDYDRWHAYIRQSILETVIGKDILNLRTVQKPALFRQAFDLITHYPAQEISYTKLLGQLQDKGNTDLVKHYVELYEGAFLMKALQKYSAKAILRKASSPKILLMCPALHTVTQGPDVLDNPQKRGRLFELVVGTDLARLPGNLHYWRNGPNEVDYVYTYASRIYAIEVKSGLKKSARGLDEFLKFFPKALPIIITPENYVSFSKDPSNFLNKLS